MNITSSLIFFLFYLLIIYLLLLYLFLFFNVLCINVTNKLSPEQSNVILSTGNIDLDFLIFKTHKHNIRFRILLSHFSFYQISFSNTQLSNVNNTILVTHYRIADSKFENLKLKNSDFDEIIYI